MANEHFGAYSNLSSIITAIATKLNLKGKAPVEVTQEEYDALPASKNTDSTPYMIKDSVPLAAYINDNVITVNNAWSASKTKTYIDTSIQTAITDVLSASY